MTTGEKISECRKEKGLTQTELAEILGVTRQAVSRWEGDLAFPETDTLIKMSKLFAVSCDWLLKYDEESRGGAQLGDDMSGAQSGEEAGGAQLGDDMSGAQSGEEAGGAQLGEDTGGAQHEDASGDKSGERGNLKFGTGGINLNLRLNNFYIEYKSKIRLGKLPLVHVNIGYGRVAKGIISVGFVSVGIISIGLVSLGALSFGLLCLGILSFASISAGVIAAGGVSVGCIALGGVAIGMFSLGGCAVGLFACGGYANGYYVAIGDVAVGGIALGKTRADGSILSVLKPQYEVMKAAVYEKLDQIPKIWSVFTAWSRGLFDAALKSYLDLNIKVKV